MPEIKIKRIAMESAETFPSAPAARSVLSQMLNEYPGPIYDTILWVGQTDDGDYKVYGSRNEEPRPYPIQGK